MTAIESPTAPNKNVATSGPLKLPPVKPSVAEKPEPPKELSPEESKALSESGERMHKKQFAGMARTKKEDQSDDKKDAKAAAKESDKEPAKENEKADAAKAKTEDKSKAEPAKTAANDAAKTDDKPEKKAALKPVAKKEKPEVDLEKLVKSTIEATAKSIQPKEPAPKTEVDDVPAARREEFLAIKRAEEKNASHKGASVTALKVFKAEQDYITAWEKENPGKKYNPKSDEHDAWYEANMPEWMEEAAEVGTELAKREAIEKELKESLKKEYAPLQEKLSKLEMMEVERRVERVAPHQANLGIVAAIQAINPELLKEGVKIEEADPVAHEILMEYGPKITSETHASLMLFATRGESLKDGDPMRKRIIDAASEMETQIQNASEEDRTAPDGKTFVNLDQWAALSEAERGKHWTITGELVAMKLANETAAEASKRYKAESEKLEKLAVARGWTKNGATERTQAEPESESEEGSDNNGKPRSPSTAAQTVIKPGQTTEAKPSKDGGDILLSNMFGR